MKKIYLYFSLFFCCLFINNISAAALHKNLWSKWQVHNPLSQEIIPHTEWQEFLHNCVVTNEEGINLVNYPNLTTSDLNLLKQYITHMAQINISNYNRNEQLAYWINLYNALTVQTVIRYYPISSIQEINISPGLFNIGPWGANLITIEDTRLSLDDIYHRIIRPIWNDPRTHYALNNATIGAANLSKKAMQGTTLETQLNEAAANHINSLRGIQVIEKNLIVSKMYHWFAEDFGGSERNLIKHLTQFAREPLKSELKHIKKINSYIYNWHLNSTISAIT